MKYYILVSPGILDIAAQEVKSLLKITPTIKNNIIEFSTTEQNALQFAQHTQTARRLLISCGSYKSLEDFKPEILDIIPKNITCKIEVENVKGQDNRTALSKQIYPKKKLNIDQKKPQLLIIVYNNEEELIVGIDLLGIELNKREYRIFPHSASFKGDLATFFIKKSDFKQNEKLLVGFCKDGTLAIEAALSVTNKPLLDLEEKQHSFHNLPLFKDITLPISEPHTETIVHAFDPSSRNITAASKNARLAHVKDYVKFQQLPLDELEYKYQDHQFNRMILHVTKKDEDKLNEIYHQATQLLQSGGKLLLIARPQWDISISERFTLLEDTILPWGKNSEFRYWLLQRK